MSARTFFFLAAAAVSTLVLATPLTAAAAAPSSSGLVPASHAAPPLRPAAVPAAVPAAAPADVAARRASATTAQTAGPLLSSTGAQWSVAPANADGPDGRISLRHTIDPGGTVVDAIAITNLGAEPATYAVSAGDGVVGDDGAFDIAAGAPSGSGTWIALEGVDAGTLAVSPGETRVLSVRITVPADVVPGDHPAGIVVGVTRAADGVSVTNRIGVRVHLRVSGEVAPALQTTGVDASFIPSWLPFAPGILRVETRVANTGNVRLGALAGVSGVGVDAAELAGEPAELLPGDSATLVTETAAWPVVALFGTATVTPVVLGGDAVSAPPAIDSSFGAPAVSWTGLGVLAVVAAALAAGIGARRRGRARLALAMAAEPIAGDRRVEETVR